MSDLHTFKSVCNRYTFTVKAEFLQNCSTPEKFTTAELMTKYRMRDSLHNPAGPAVVFHENTRQPGLLQFYINGKELIGEDAKKMEHNYKFKGKLSDIVNQD